MPEAEIAPTVDSRTRVDRPVAVVEAVNTASPLLWYVHVDHLHRPIRMTNAAKASVWDAQFLPWGGVHSITGTATLDARFPGQWCQLETGLHYNWHRSYDPTIGRYTQPDPLGFVDGPSVHGYAKGQPQQAVDLDGLLLMRPTPPQTILPRYYPPVPPSLGPTPNDPPPPPVAGPGHNNPPGDNRQADYEAYKNICNMPPPKGLHPCDLARWKLRKAKACYNLRGAWDDKYLPGRHKIPQDETARHIKKLEDYIRDNCERMAACYAR